MIRGGEVKERENIHRVRGVVVICDKIVRMVKIVRIVRIATRMPLFILLMYKIKYKPFSFYKYYKNVFKLHRSYAGKCHLF